MTDYVGRWTAGSSYGPVLSQTDLYLLGSGPQGIELQLNPIIANKHPSFHLVFNLLTGRTGGFNPGARDSDLPFADKDQPATLPRVAELYIITDMSPWCTVVKNPAGVTMADVCTAVWKEYVDNDVTEEEFASLPPRLQEQVKRIAAHNSMQQQPGGWGGYYNQTPAPPSRFKRVNWLRDRTFLEGLSRRDDYALQRLGFKAPNIFFMELVA